MSTVFGSHNGPGTYAHYLADAFKADPVIDFHLVVPDTPYRRPNFHCVSKGKSSRVFYGNLQRAALDLASSFENPPIIHTNNSHTIWLLKNYGGAVISQVNDYQAANILQQPIYKILNYGFRKYLSLIWRRYNEKQAMGFSTKLICNSFFTQTQIQRAYLLNKQDNSLVFHKAVDAKFFNYPKTEHKKFNLFGKKRILFVGSSWRTKGLDLAIQAMPQVIARVPDAALIVAGKCGQGADRYLMNLPQKMGIETNVQFLGHVSKQDLPALLNQCDALTLPSREEAFGVAILEALAAGLPVVGANAGGIPEIIAGSKYSLLIDPKDRKSLAAAFDTVLSLGNDKPLVKAEGVEIAKRFSKSIMINKIRDLYLLVQKSR